MQPKNAVRMAYCIIYLKDWSYTGIIIWSNPEHNIDTGYFSNPLYPADIKYFDIKLLFVVTAVYPDSRKNLRKDKNAVYELKKFLEAIPLDENLMNVSFHSNLSSINIWSYNLCFLGGICAFSMWNTESYIQFDSSFTT